MRFQCPFCRGIVAVENSDLGIDVQCGYCGEVVTVPYSRVATGSVIADFIILQELGRGGMGVVYLTHQISLDRPAALKVLSDNYANNAEFVVNFIKEARSAAKLNHPHIVQAFAVGEDEGIFYFAMEFIDGETMKSVLKREKVLTVDKAITVIQQIAEALDYAWKEQKLIHRDIKPDNIMMTKNGRAKLADLGLSRVAGEIDDSESDEVMGTPQYISPEHLTGAPMDNRSDIYSLGASFFHLVTGKFPFEGKTASEIARKHLDEKLRLPHEVNPEIPESVSRIILKMMEKNIKDRYQDAAELVDDLRMARRSKQPSTATGKITGVFTLKKGSKTGLHLKNKTGSMDVSTKTSSFSSDGTRTETTTLQPESYVDPRTTQVEVQIGKLRNLMIALVVFFALLFIGGGIAAWQMLKPKPADPAAANNNKKTTDPKTATTTTTPVTPPGGKTSEQSLYVKKINDIIDYLSTHPDKEAEFLSKCDEFFALYSNPSSPEEKQKYGELLNLYIPTDEKIRVIKFRKEARDKHLALLNERKIEDDKRLDVEKQKAAQDKQKNELLAKQQREERERKEKLEKRTKEYTEYVEKQKDTMRRSYIDIAKRKEFKGAGDIFAPALKEPAKVKGNSPDEEGIAKEFSEWAKKYQNAIDVAEKVSNILNNSGKEMAGKQIEVRSGHLGVIKEIKNENIIVNLTLDDKTETIPVSSIDPAFLQKILKKLTEKLNNPDAPFYYLLTIGEFNKLKEIAPDEDWKKEVADNAFEYFKMKISFASEDENNALKKKYMNHPDYKRAKKAVSPNQ